MGVWGQGRNLAVYFNACLLSQLTHSWVSPSLTQLLHIVTLSKFGSHTLTFCSDEQRSSEAVGPWNSDLMLCFWQVGAGCHAS